MIEGQYMYFYIVFNITYFSHQLCTLLYITFQKKKKPRKQTTFNINTYFMIRTTYVEFQTSTTIILEGNLTSDREIKPHV
jgi:hypothetical protein